jgi:hypothetical protein
MKLRSERSSVQRRRSLSKVDETLIREELSPEEEKLD